MMEKILEIIKKCGYTIAVSVLVISIAMTSLALAGCETEEEGDKDHSETESASSESIPEFSKKPEAIDQAENGEYVAYYYNDVTSEQVSEYVALLEKELKISFKSEIYPKTAVYGEKLIAIHYNVTEKKLSVTIAEKEYNENSKNNIGE